MERIHNTHNSQLCKKLQKFDCIAKKRLYVRNYALKVSCSLAKNYLAVETQPADK
jgi:hypothetical protein